MTDAPLDHPAPNTPEPTWQQQKQALVFLSGLGLGLLSIFLAQVISTATHGDTAGCLLPALGLFIAGFLFASKPLRSLAFGLLLGLVIALPVSIIQWLSALCAHGC